VVCGKPVEGKAVRIAKGTLKSAEWRERSLFGVAHEGCFAGAVDSPTMVLAELRRASRESGSQSTTR
jgi:hypothetical protein